MTLITPSWPAPGNIHAFTTTRTSWGNPNIKSSDPAERERLVKGCHLPSQPIWLKQTHSTRALTAELANLDQEADASYAQQAGQICIVLTADCLPILVCNKQGTEVAAIHAGWRGLANGVIENTIKALHSAPNDLLIWLGPAIGPQKFEVGADVYKTFTDLDPDAAKCFIPGAPEKWLGNLYELASMRLNKLGIYNVYGGDHCTHTEIDKFYSWRRDQTTLGRMASVIWLE